LQYHSLIVYTSSDSTLQVAAHEDIIPIPKLYQYCEKIRAVTNSDNYRIARIIARPFTGKPGRFKFCQERSDYAIKPPTESVLDRLKEKDYNVISIGKINDIFDGQGITKVVKSSFTNMDTLSKLTDIMAKKFTGLCFINLSDLDALYGHKRDPEGYAKGVEEFDVEVPLMLNKLENDDLLIITADHGCDPTFKGNSHTRENVPVIIYSRLFKEPKRLDPLKSMADIGATIADNFEVEKPQIGESFLDKLV
jgi:phosphopentomutase